MTIRQRPLVDPKSFETAREFLADYAIQAEHERLRTAVDGYGRLIAWALGEGKPEDGPFPLPPTLPEPPYWWRPELRRRANAVIAEVAAPSQAGSAGRRLGVHYGSQGMSECGAHADGLVPDDQLTMTPEAVTCPNCRGWLPIVAPADIRNCPTCGSPQRHLHPAVQHEGEVQVCRDPWHGPTGETFAEQVNRLEMMLEDSETWDLSENDRLAIRAVLGARERLRVALHVLCTILTAESYERGSLQRAVKEARAVLKGQ